MYQQHCADENQNCFEEVGFGFSVKQGICVPASWRDSDNLDHKKSAQMFSPQQSKNITFNLITCSQPNLLTRWVLISILKTNSQKRKSRICWFAEDGEKRTRNLPKCLPDTAALTTTNRKQGFMRINFALGQCQQINICQTASS